jgi:hypothetical protein
MSPYSALFSEMCEAFFPVKHGEKYVTNINFSYASKELQKFTKKKANKFYSKSSTSGIQMQSLKSTLI